MEYDPDAVSAGIDGAIYSRDDLTINGGGSLQVTTQYQHSIVCNDDLVIAGGTLDIRPTDDGLNASGWGSDPQIYISGGDITIINEQGRDADGLDSNGSIEIAGGNLFISVNGSGSNAAIDYGSENGGSCAISGGTVIAAGGSTMVEGFDSSSTQCFIMYATNASAVTLKNAAGSVLLSETIPCGFSSIVLSTPELQLGETCTLSVGGTEDEIVVDNSTSGGFDMNGMFGGGMQHDGTFGGRGGRGDQSFTTQPDGGNSDTESTPLEMLTRDVGQDGQPGKPGGLMPQDNGAPDGFQDGNGAVPPEGFQIPEDSPDMQNGEGIRREPSETDPGETQPREQNEIGDGGRRNDKQFMQREQNQGRPQDATASETSAIAPDTLALVGVSIMFLLIGISVALKVKH